VPVAPRTKTRLGRGEGDATGLVRGGETIMGDEQRIEASMMPHQRPSMTEPSFRSLSRGRFRSFAFDQSP